jgi:hypothetical protein
MRLSKKVNQDQLMNLIKPMNIEGTETICVTVQRVGSGKIGYI